MAKPSWASLAATARPMPPETPVTKATLLGLAFFGPTFAEIVMLLLHSLTRETARPRYRSIACIA
ncbi:MAG: hypothetical protein JWO38_7044 [Gemmataceae bacterium]|nr:hypothetical protein [Gemmataceae bacterium]